MFPRQNVFVKSAMPSAAMLCTHCEDNAILQEAVSTVGGGELGASVETRDPALSKFLLREELPLLWSWPRL